MPTIKCAILVFSQLICYNLYTQNASQFILENKPNDHSEILATDYADSKSTSDIITAVATDKEESQPLAKPLKISRTSSAKNDREDRLGLNWSIGYGLGHSSHASSYAVDDGFRTKQFSGFRTIVLDTKIGWGFHKNIVAFGTWKFSPGNTTISPYRSNFLGGGLSVYFGDLQQFAIHGGAGKYQAKISRNEVVGNGLLVNYGAVVKLSNNFGVEINVLSGKLEVDDANPTTFQSSEFNFTAGMVYLF